MDVRIGVTQHPRELDLELADDTDRDELTRSIEEALSDDDKVLWLTDRKGRRVGIPSAKVAYVEIGAAEERRVGFGAP
ncbi:MAG TPA: DUF3107 domain-containing protein [Acidimicrobiales bacterium]|nr:DUF3107 domain-containing protein [Acidimicrobiales bacterium]